MKKRHSGEQIVAILRQADVALGKGQKVPEVCKQLGISEQTYYRWRTKYGGMDPQMARQLQELQKENARLKRLVADQALDNQIIEYLVHRCPRVASVEVGGDSVKTAPVIIK